MSAATLIERALCLGVSLSRNREKLVMDGPEYVLTGAFVDELKAHKPEILALLDLADSEPANAQLFGSAAVDLARALGPLTPAEVAAIPSGSLYLADPLNHRARPIGVAPAHASVSPAPSLTPSPTPAVHVAHVRREPRHRMRPMKDADRVCAACGARGPLEGPVPGSWDFHAVRGRPDLLGSCSAACRSKLGFVERRPR